MNGRTQCGVTSIGVAYSIQVTPVIGGGWRFSVVWKGGSRYGTGRTEDDAWERARAVLNEQGVVV